MITETMVLRRKGAGATIKEYTIDYPCKFKSIKDGERYANNLKRFIKDLCEDRKWFCFVFIGVSEIDRKTAKIVKKKTGKKGRPRLVYKKKHKDIDVRFVEPHIHIYMYGLPGGALAEEIKRYLFKTSKCNSLEDIKVKKVKRKYQLKYIKEQSIKHRVAYRDTDETLLLNNLTRLSYLKGLDIKL